MCNWSSICLSPVCLLLMGQGWELLSATSEGSGNILQFINGKILFILTNYFHCRWRRFSRKHTQDQIKSSRKKLSKLLQLIFQKGWRTFVPSTMLPVWKVRKIVFSPYAHTRVYTQSAICLFHHCSIKYSGSSAMDPIISFSRAMFEEMYHLWAQEYIIATPVLNIRHIYLID